MATTTNSSELPGGYRIAAAVITVLVHAAILVPALLWQSGGVPLQRTAPNNSFGEESGRTAVVFLPVARKATTPLPTVKQGDQPAFVITKPAQEPTRANDDANALAHHESEDNQDSGYVSAVRAAIKRQWEMQGGKEVLAGCTAAIDQVEGGKVVRAWTVNCNNLPVRERILLETVVMRTQLPYAGFESAFHTHLELGF